MNWRRLAGMIATDAAGMSVAVAAGMIGAAAAGMTGASTAGNSRGNAGCSKRFRRDNRRLCNRVTGRSFGRRGACLQIGPLTVCE